MNLHLGTNPERPKIAVTITQEESRRYLKVPGFVRALNVVSSNGDIDITEEERRVTFELIADRVGSSNDIDAIDARLTPVLSLYDWITVKSKWQSRMMRDMYVYSEPSTFDGRYGLGMALGWPKNPDYQVNDFATQAMLTIANSVGYETSSSETYAQIRKVNREAAIVSERSAFALLRSEPGSVCNDEVYVTGTYLENPRQVIVCLAGAIAVSVADEAL